MVFFNLKKKKHFKFVTFNYYASDYSNKDALKKIYLLLLLTSEFTDIPIN